MVKLRLARFGRKNLPSYRLIAIQARSKRQGEAIEYLGTYDPKGSPSKFEINAERVKYWLSVGAQPSDTVRGFLAKEGLVKAVKKEYKKAPGKKRKAQIDSDAAKKEEEAKKAEEAKAAEEAAKAQAAAEAPAETPAETEAAKPEETTEEAPAEEAKPE
jgi:small subunit ribosomal protein S16